MKFAVLMVSALLIGSFAQAQNVSSNEIDMMDNATPEQLEQMIGGIDSQQVPEGTNADVEINVSIRDQTLTISYPTGQFSVLVSTARPGYHTKTGCFAHPYLELMHYSSKYENSPMPHSMFFYGGFAIHGTNEEKHLGHPASHGCVRVSKANATALYQIVKQYGEQNTIICVH